MEGQSTTRIRRIDHENLADAYEFVYPRVCDVAVMPKPNKRHYLQTIRNWLNDPNFAGFFTENAVCMGAISPDPTNWAAKIAREYCWLSNGRDGDRVLRAWEHWAADMGATHIFCATWIPFDPNHTMRKVMDRKGYSEYEMLWAKELV